MTRFLANSKLFNQWSQSQSQSQNQSQYASESIKQRRPPKTKNKRRSIEIRQKASSIRIANKFKPDFEIQEEVPLASPKTPKDNDFSSNDSDSPFGGKSSGSRDSHSDGEDFNPNQGNFSMYSAGTESCLENSIYQKYDLMVVLDRANDLVTPFLSQTSYIGLLDDLLKGNFMGIFLECESEIYLFIYGF